MYVYIYIHVHIHICKYVCIYMYVYIYIYVHIHICKYVCVYISNWSTLYPWCWEQPCQSHPPYLRGVNPLFFYHGSLGVFILRGMGSETNEPIFESRFCQVYVVHLKKTLWYPALGVSRWESSEISFYHLTNVCFSKFRYRQNIPKPVAFGRKKQPFRMISRFPDLGHPKICVLSAFDFSAVWKR